MLEATIGGAGANSFVTMEEAEAYFAARLHAEAWGGATAAAREQALRMAARMLNRLRWHGTPGSATQALCWPRVGAPGAGAGTIPGAVKAAQCEEALAWLSPSLVRRRALQAAQVAEAQVEGARETYAPADPTTLLSAEARALLTGWLRLGGTLVTEAGGGQ
jgi:hypothetical protein